MERFLAEQGATWTFNAPHSSQMGGVWERMITCRILDSMLMQMGSSKLTHEVLTTFLAEVTAIVDNRPLVPVSMDPTDPFILTLASLRTQKVHLQLANLTTRTYTSSSGAEFKACLIHSGTDGASSTWLHCNPIESGHPTSQILK